MATGTTLSPTAAVHNQTANMTGVEGINDEHSKLTIGILATLYTLIFIIGITGECFFWLI